MLGKNNPNYTFKNNGSKLSVTPWKEEFAANMHMSARCSEVAEKQMEPYKQGRLSPPAALGQEKQDAGIGTKMMYFRFDPTWPSLC